MAAEKDSLKTIVLTKRGSGNDYHAGIQDETGYWGRGLTSSEAIGDLIRSHPEKFGIKIDTSNLKST